MPSAPSPPRISAISPPARSRVSARLASSSDRGQLRHAQAPQGEELARSPSALPSPFHSDQLVVVESGRALVWSAHGEADSARQLFSLEELVQAIHEYLEENNRQPKPFLWTASVEKLLEKANRCKAILETAH